MPSWYAIGRWCCCSCTFRRRDSSSRRSPSSVSCARWPRPSSGAVTMLELRERDFRSFFVVPERAYGPGSPFVSIFDADLRRFLDARQNPLLQDGRGALTYFTALRDGVPVGRITAHAHDASNRLHGWNRSSFGYFDCIDDPEVAARLLDAAERWGRERGHDAIWGNFNLTAMAPAGVVTEGFDEPPYSDQLWNPPHIPRLLEGAGYTREF